MFDLRAIAVQGLGFSPRQVAVQGFAVVELVQPKAGDSAGRARNIEAARRQRLLAEDEIVLMAVISVFTSGAIH